MTEARLEGSWGAALDYLLSGDTGHIPGECYSHHYLRPEGGAVLDTFFHEGPWPGVAWRLDGGWVTRTSEEAFLFLPESQYLPTDSRPSDPRWVPWDGTAATGWLEAVAELVGPGHDPEAVPAGSWLLRRASDAGSGYAYLMDREERPDGLLSLRGEDGTELAYDPIAETVADKGGRVLARGGEPYVIELIAD